MWPDVKQWILSSRRLAPLFYRLRGIEGVFPDADTQLCIEGFLRSGNSFAVALVNQHYPGLAIAHHTHCIAALRLARRHSVPTIVLIRDPLDAIASNTLRAEHNTGKRWNTVIANGLETYETYHAYLLQEPGLFHFLPFETLVSRPNRLLELTAGLLGTDFPGDDGDNMATQARQAIREHERRKGEPAGASALPSNEKELNLARIREVIASVEYINRLQACRELHRRLAGLAGD